MKLISKEVKVDSFDDAEIHTNLLKYTYICVKIHHSASYFMNN